MQRGSDGRGSDGRPHPAAAKKKQKVKALKVKASTPPKAKAKKKAPAKKLKAPRRSSEDVYNKITGEETPEQAEALIQEARDCDDFLADLDNGRTSADIGNRWCDLIYDKLAEGGYEIYQ